MEKMYVIENYQCSYATPLYIKDRKFAEDFAINTFFGVISMHMWHSRTKQSVKLGDLFCEVAYNKSTGFVDNSCKDIYPTVLHGDTTNEADWGKLLTDQRPLSCSFSKCLDGSQPYLMDFKIYEAGVLMLSLTLKEVPFDANVKFFDEEEKRREEERRQHEYHEYKLREQQETRNMWRRKWQRDEEEY